MLKHTLHMFSTYQIVLVICMSPAPGLKVQLDGNRPFFAGQARAVIATGPINTSADGVVKTIFGGFAV